MKHAFRAKLFLIIVILALVAASIGYLVESPTLVKRPHPTAKAVVSDQAKVVIDGFRFSKNISEDEGWELTARRAEMKKDSGTARLDDLKAVFSGHDGTVLTMKADKGQFDSDTKAVRVTAKDKDVTITSNNGYVMNAKDLSWDDCRKELSTKNAVSLTGRNIRIEGRGMVAKSDLQEVKITGGVKTTFTQER